MIAFVPSLPTNYVAVPNQHHHDPEGVMFILKDPLPPTAAAQ